MGTEESGRLQRRSEQVMPGGVNSPVRAFKSVGGAPRFIERGKGPYLFDVDGNRYIDFCCSWGPLILGHGDRDVVAAVRAQVGRGMTYGAPTEEECLLAEFIVNQIEHVERIRFVSSGTEATMSAIRLARGHTGRDLILKFEGCYHGHADHLLVSAGSGLATFSQPSSAGVPDALTSQTAVLPLDDEQRVEDFVKKNGDKLAAVIIEGVPANNGLLIQRPEFLRTLRSSTEGCGALLILDEVITGFRLGMGGAAALYGIRPDLVAYGKVVGGGLPVGAFGGRADVMERLSPLGPVYQAGTLSGNPVAMMAGLTTLRKLADGNIYADLERKAKRFVQELRESACESSFNVAHIGSIFWLVFQDDVPRTAASIAGEGIARFNRLHGRALEHGIYLPPSGYEVCFVSAAHTDEILTEAAGVLSVLIDQA